MSVFIRSLLLVMLGLVAACERPAAVVDPVEPSVEPASTTTLASYVAGMDAHSGLIPFYVDREQGKLYLALESFGEELLYQYSLPQGVGSNDLGLDRGQLMDAEPALVRFEDAGSKVMLRQLNTRYRANSDNPLERLAVEEAFASSVLWGFPVVLRSDEVVLVDATEFLLRDSHAVGRQLEELSEGVGYKADASRSALYLPRTKGFPRNSEFEATITLVGNKPGGHLKSVTPDAYSVSVRMHHSFIALPKVGYQPRRFHPESGYWPFEYTDYAVPIERDLKQRFIPRHRLQKRDPQAALSEPVNPIIYYLDPGTPQPVRDALLDGARWWNDAFEEAGYRDAFQVKMLPPEADPMDVRYNVIQWVHRSTRGWSYGASVVDPRTGEIIKGHVTLGSLRVRQDYLIAQGMTSPFTGEEVSLEGLTEMALARIRQLSAHEVGHTLGLAHNFAASTNGRASVMDYPHPRIALDDSGEVSLAEAYASGMGAWDKRAIRYGYGDFGVPEQEWQALRAFIARNVELGLRYVSDPDARKIQDPHPDASLWENGDDALVELERLIALREVALRRFGPQSIPYGEPWSSLEEVLIPVYYYPRYQVEAVGKSLGGVRYRYALREPGEEFSVQVVDGATQKRALGLLLNTLDPAYLALSQRIRQLIPPKALGYERSRESSKGFTGVVLDPVSMAQASAQHSLDVLLHPQRLARLAQQHADDTSVPSVGQLLEALSVKVLQRRTEGFEALVHQRVSAIVVEQWLALGQDKTLPPELRAEVWSALREARQWFEEHGEVPGYSVFYQWLARQIEQGEPEDERPPTGSMPPGSPIGAY